jgi:hypothetical protein
MKLRTGLALAALLLFASAPLSADTVVTIGEASLDAASLTVQTDDALRMAGEMGQQMSREQAEAAVIVGWATQQATAFMAEHANVTDEEVDQAIAAAVALGHLQPWNEEWSTFAAEVMHPSMIRLATQAPAPAEAEVDAEYELLVATAPQPVDRYAMYDRQTWHNLVAECRAGRYTPPAVPRSEEEARAARRPLIRQGFASKIMSEQLLELSGAMESDYLLSVARRRLAEDGVLEGAEDSLRTALLQRELRLWTIRWCRDNLDVRDADLRARVDAELDRREKEARAWETWLFPSAAVLGETGETSRVVVLPDTE